MNMRDRARRLRLLGGVAAALMLGGCVSFSPDGGLPTAQTVAYTRLARMSSRSPARPRPSASQQRAEALLTRPLTPDSAVQIALLKNRGLQAAFNELGVSEAVYVQATPAADPDGFPVPPRRQLRTGDRAPDPDWAVRARDASRRGPRSPSSASGRPSSAPPRPCCGSPPRPAGNTTATVAANQQVAFMQQALGTAESASELAKQLGESGALNKLEQAREHAFYQELGAQLARARIEQKIERERLIRQLGLWGRDIDFRLPSSPAAAAGAHRLGAQDIERQALERRVDLQALRHDLNAVAGQFGLTNATRFVTDVELAGICNYERTKSVTLDEDGGRRGRAREGQAARSGGRVHDPDLRLRRGERPQRAGDLHGGGQPPGGAGRQRPLRSARGLPALPRQLRPRAPLPEPRPAACRRRSRTRPCCNTAACWST